MQSFQRRRARRAGIANAQCGAATVIQRFASGLRLNLHFHTLLLDGVFHLDDHGTLVFTELPPPSDDDIKNLVITIRHRILRMLRRRGFLDDDNLPAPDTAADLRERDPALAALMGAAITNTSAFANHPDQHVKRIGRDPRARGVDSRAPLQAHADGFDLHAAIAIPAHDRQELERICRYLLRPAVAQERLSLTDEGRILLELKSEWNDGTSHIDLSPLELLARLACFIPRPRTNLLIYHGVLAPNAKLRARAVRYGRPHDPAVIAPPTTLPLSTAEIATRNPRPKPCNRWPHLMRRAFGIDVLECTRCDGRVRLLATIEAPALVRKILDHFGLPSRAPKLAPPRAPPEHHSSQWH